MELDDYLAQIKKHPVVRAVVTWIGHCAGIWRETELVDFGYKAFDSNRGRISRLYYMYKFQKVSAKYNLFIRDFSKIGKNFKMANPAGVLIDTAGIGDDCMVFKGVSIGSVRSGKRTGVPKLEDRVVVCANAVIFGNVTIGHDTLIAGNSFVDFDVPPHSIVIGNPGVIHHKENASKDYCFKD